MTSASVPYTSLRSANFAEFFQHGDGMADTTWVERGRLHAPEDAWDRLAALLNARMDERSLTQADLARAAGVNVATIRKLQRAEQSSFWLSKIEPIERALGWAQGTLRQILDGGGLLNAAEEERRQRAVVAEGEQLADETRHEYERPEDLEAETRAQRGRLADQLADLAADDDEAVELAQRIMRRRLEKARETRDIRPRDEL